MSRCRERGAQRSLGQVGFLHAAADERQVRPGPGHLGDEIQHARLVEAQAAHHEVDARLDVGDGFIVRVGRHDAAERRETVSQDEIGARRAGEQHARAIGRRFGHAQLHHREAANPTLRHGA
jgi:hypothetical protein